MSRRKTIGAARLNGAGGFDRRAIMRDAHKRYRDGQRLALGWAFAQCLKTAWQAARIRQGDTQATMNRIAERIEEHLSRRIVLALPGPCLQEKPPAGGMFLPQPGK